MEITRKFSGTTIEELQKELEDVFIRFATEINQAQAMILEGAWNTTHLIIGGVHVWKCATDSKLHAKVTAPTSDGDGAALW